MSSLLHVREDAHHRSGSRGRPGGAGQHRVPRPAPTFSLHAIITYLSTIRLFIDIFLNLNVTFLFLQM